MADGIWRVVFNPSAANPPERQHDTAMSRPRPTGGGLSAAGQQVAVRPNVSRMDPRYPSVSARSSRPVVAASTGLRSGRAGDAEFLARYQPRYVAPLTTVDAPTSTQGKPDASAKPAPGAPGLASAIDPVSRASAVTGLSTRYLTALFGHESGGDDHARASTSSATGAAQFIDSTWVRMLRRHGQRYGLDTSISRHDLLRLRRDRGWSALMAAELALENRREMEPALGRRISEGEAYLAHFLGSGDAVRLIRARDRGARDAAALFPTAAQANRNVFYDRRGRPRTAREVYQRQTRAFSNEPLGGQR